MKFKINDIVSYCGCEGRVYHLGEDWFGVEFLNVEPESEYKDKYLEFHESGRLHVWAKDQIVTKIHQHQNGVSDGY